MARWLLFGNIGRISGQENMSKEEHQLIMNKLAQIAYEHKLANLNAVRIDEEDIAKHCQTCNPKENIESKEEVKITPV